MRQVPQNVLLAIQQRFHALIRERAGELIDGKSVALPELSELLSADKPKEWLPIPGMYGQGLLLLCECLDRSVI